MPSNGREIIQRYDKLSSEAGPHFQRCEKMAPFLAPSRVGVNGEMAPGDSQTRGVYDSTAMLSAELSAHFIAGNIFNPGQRWFDYVVEPNANIDPDELDEINEWCEESRNRTLDRASRSSFYAEGAETLIDWIGFGTGFKIMEENPQPSNKTIQGFRGFSVIAEKTGRFLIQEGVDGRVDTAFRRFILTARIIKARWGSKAGASMPPNVQQAIDKGEGDKPFKIVHAIYPRDKMDLGYGAKGMPWSSCWVEYESKHIIFESGYEVFPVSSPRYHRTPSEVFGRGRGDIAFPDTWSLNTAKRMGFEDWALKIKPPILHGHDSVFGTLRLIPGGPTSVNLHGKDIRTQIMPFETGSHPEISNLKEEELRKSIRQIFYVDHILALMEVNKSEMTAYEYARKLELLYKLIGPVYGRAEWELLHNDVDIMFDTQYRARDFSPPPPAMERTNGQIKLVFQNPLARAQRSGDAEAFVLALNDVAGFAQVKPEVLDWLDPDKTMLGVMRGRGVPASWTRRAKEVLDLRAARDEQNQKQMALDQAEQGANALGKVAPVLAQANGKK